MEAREQVTSFVRRRERPGMTLGEIRAFSPKVRASSPSTGRQRQAGI